ncbi:MAG TPA: cell division protein ZapA [Allosphingosinicella sp.]|nr:cell division protein ZapA [Allosphingosinicella sp.]
MANVELEIGSRRYIVACRDGEEEHLRSTAALVDGKAREAASALGTLSEARQLLFASLLLADQLQEVEAASASPAAAAAEQREDPAVADALERLAERMERLAERLENDRSNP